ncbi:MAG: hypothetical protein WD872_03565 [Pirellulaceae bacterium]
MAWRIPRFSTLQLLLAAALCALLLGLFTSAWRASDFAQVTAVRFSPDGKHLVARYQSGSVQVWNVESRPRLSARLTGRGLYGYEAEGVHFAGDAELVDIDQRFGSGGQPLATVRTVDLRTSAVTSRFSFVATNYVGVYEAAGDTVAIADWSGAKIECYSLADRQLVCQISNVYPYLDTALTPDGRTLLWRDANASLMISDTASGQTVQTIPAVNVTAAAIDPAATRVAMVGGQLTRQGNAIVELYDLQRGQTVQEIATDLPAPHWTTFTADGRRLAVADWQAVELYDLATRRRLGRVLLDEPSQTTFFSLVMQGPNGAGFGQPALSPDGRTLATIDGSRIRCWNMQIGKLRAAVGGQQRGLQIAIFTIGFAIWSAAWGIVSRRQRERNPPAESGPAAAVVPPSRPPPQVAGWHGVGSFFLAMTALVALLYGVANWQSIVNDPVSELLNAVLCIIPIVIVLGGGVLLVAFVHNWWRPLFGRIGYLQLLTHDRGRQRQHGQVVGWFAGESSLIDTFPDDLDEVSRRLSELYQVPVCFDRPLLVVGLDRQVDLDALFRQHIPAPGIFSHEWRLAMVTVCEQTAQRLLGEARRDLRSALVLAALHRRLGGYLEPWPYATISYWVNRDARGLAELRPALRRIKRRLADNSGYDPLPALTISNDELGALRLKANDPAAWYDVQERGDVLATWSEFLLGEPAPPERRARTLAWLRAARPGDDVQQSAAEHLGLTLDELLTQWRAWIEAAEPLASELPSPTQLATIRGYLVPLMLDPRANPAARAQAARVLGAAGFAAGAGAPIALLAEPPSQLRTDAVRDLESISGQSLGDDPRAWRAWFDALPADQRQPERAPPALTKTTAAILAEPNSAPEAMQATLVPLAPPIELKLCWGLMVIGGLVALALPIAFFFMVGPVGWPGMYFSLLVGVVAMSRGAAREVRGAAQVPALQMLNLIACDPVNLILGILAQNLLRRGHVQQYLHLAANGRVG